MIFRGENRGVEEGLSGELVVNVGWNGDCGWVGSLSGGYQLGEHRESWMFCCCCCIESMMRL